MKKFKFFIILIAIVFNVLLCSKVSFMLINKHTNIKLNANNDSYKLRDSFYSLDDESVNRQSSKHFQIIWGKNDKIITKEFIEDNLNNLENIRKLYIDQLEMKDTCQSINDDNGKYKTNIYLSNTGLKKINDKDTFTDCDSEGFGYIVINPSIIEKTNPPSWTLAEAYADVVILHQGGSLNKHWRNTMANWFKNQYLSSNKYCYEDTILEPDTSFFPSIVLNSNLPFPKEENSNDSWPFINYLSENPDNIDGLGLELIHSILENKDFSNVFDILSDKVDIPLQDIISNYTKRMITMDFANRDKYLYYLDELKSDTDNENKIFTNLDLSKGTWVTIPDNKVPKQGGYNVIPIKDYNKNSSITIDFKGIKNTDDGDWRATIVAMNEDNSTTYSSTWNDGENSLTLTGNETSVYLIVAATPKNFKDLSTIENEDDIPSYPYKIKLKVSSQNTNPSKSTTVTSNNDVSKNTDSNNTSDSTTNTDNKNTTYDTNKNNNFNSDQTNVNNNTSTNVCNDKIKIEMYNKIKNHYFNNLTLNFRITNTGSTSIKVKDIKLRYYYTKDGNEAQSFYCDWCSINKNPVKSNFVSISGKNNADTYLELSFNTNEILKPKEEIYIHSRIAKNNWTNYNQNNDYSFNNYANDYVQWNKVTGYVNGTLVWGNEP